MPTNVVGSKAGPKHHLPMVKCVSKVIVHNTSGLSAGVPFFIMPKGGQITLCGCLIETVFNPATNNILTLGHGANLNELFDASTSGSSIDEATAGWYESAAAKALKFAADTEIKIKYVQSGTAATTGKALFVVQYVETDLY